ncbi:hypothetical protein MFIFM68171_10515 [Madurella fahalii]|uniref:CCHC-type domain-containing protein n=1 Tax=Madurella fahalii TaxID=1157608 RepID=A0ABQ0GRF5_9PEZI
MAPTPAGLPAMTKQSTPKTMSSRLMTMKFMQRGAAAAAAAGASEASSPTTPRSDDGSAKRQKTSHASSAAGSAAAPLYDQKAIQAALEDEEKKRQAAIEKRAAELGDSHWVLEGVSSLPKISARPLLNVVQVGFAQIDYTGTSGGSDDPFDMGGSSAQTQFRRFNMKSSKAQKKESRDSNDGGSGSSSGSEEDSEDESPPVPARGEPDRGRRNAVGNSEHERTRSSASGRKGEEQKRAQQLAGKRRKKDIKLNQLTSISSAGSQAFQRPSSTLTCHGCGKPGHKVADCPNKKR